MRRGLAEAGQGLMGAVGARDLQCAISRGFASAKKMGAGDRHDAAPRLTKDLRVGGRISA